MKFCNCVCAIVLLLTSSLEDATARGIGAASSRSLLEGATQNFSTLVHYDSSIDGLSEEQQLLIKDILVKGATDWLSNVLKVRPLKKSILFERTCADPYLYYIRDNLRYCRRDCEPAQKCGPVTIPDEHLGACRKCDFSGYNCEVGEPGDGVEAEFLLYVSAIQTGKQCGSARGIIVDSGHCLQEEEFDRPTAAYLNFCPRALSTDPAHFDTQLYLILKELIHSLAFSEELYPFYHNEQGYPRTTRDEINGKPVQHFDGSYSVDPNTVRDVRMAQWTALTSDVYHTVSIIVTANVLREIRDHFNCPTMRGAELENQGGVGVARNHWEKRIFGEELMTATLSSQPVISRITLALLHDSGWYLPDYSFGGNLHWGHQAGCAFVNDSCAGWMSWAKQQKIETDPFCDGLDYRKGREGCIDGRKSAGPCFARNYTTDLPLEYQYLSRKRGGSLFIYDYCPVYSTVDYGTFKVGRSCLNPDHTPSNTSVSLEVYGSGSRCFDQSEPFVMTDEDGEKVTAEGYGAGCYEYRCSARRIFIKVGNKEIRCGGKGQKKKITVKQNGATYVGRFVCPDYDEICAGYDCINECSSHGSCLQGVCYCHPGYYGDDCSQRHAQFRLSCDDIECQNGATCNNTASDHGFVCECPAGYAGAFCERKILDDPCIGETCSGHGYCTPTKGGKAPKCNCNKGWRGTSCHKLFDFCAEAGKPCGDHGKCVANSTVCECDPNRTGAQCELVIDFCQFSNLCQHGGLCTSHFENQTFSCQCIDGYEGEQCEETYRDPCHLDPCQNGANCTRLNSTSFWCECSDGWIGTICNQEDKCLDNPCENGATCLNAELSYICICPRGYIGDRCRHLTDPCEDNPCQHGGTCRPVMDQPRGTIECDCTPEFWGEYCDAPRQRYIEP